MSDAALFATSCFMQMKCCSLPVPNDVQNVQGISQQPEHPHYPETQTILVSSQVIRMLFIGSDSTNCCMKPSTAGWICQRVSISPVCKTKKSAIKCPGHDASTSKAICTQPSLAAFTWAPPRSCLALDPLPAASSQAHCYASVQMP